MRQEERILVVLSSPSGVGKTTLTKKLQQKYNNLKYQFLIQQENQDLIKDRWRRLLFCMEKKIQRINF